MKKGIKIALIIIGIFIFALCTLIGIFVFKDLKIEKKLKTEIQELNNIMESTDFDEKLFKEKINNTVSSGDYYKVERAYKNYLRDYNTSISNIISFYKNSNLASLISIDNYKNDGKSFVNSKATLNSSKKEIIKLKETFDSMKTEEKALSYIDNTLDKYYIDYYKKIIGEVKQTHTEKQLSNQMKEFTLMIDNIYKVFDFLSANKNEWEISNGKIYFTSDKLINEYTKLLENITTSANNITNEKNESKA